MTIKELYQGQKPLSRFFYLLRNCLGKFSYNLIWLPCRILFLFFVHFQVKNQEKLKDLKGSLIIAANHTSFVDPFLIGAAFSFNSKIYPIWFATAPRYYKFPLFFPFIWLLCSFPIYKKIGLEKSLTVPLDVLKQGGVIGIFPEGGIHHLGRQRKGRRGAAFLALKTRKPVLIVKIEGALDLSFKRFLLRKNRVKIIVGELLKFSSRTKFPDGLNKASDLIINKIRKLG